MRLSQTDTGKPQPERLARLDQAIKEAAKEAKGSYMTHVTVHVFDLAMVLDRLEKLEGFYGQVVSLLRAECIDVD